MSRAWRKRSYSWGIDMREEKIVSSMEQEKRIIRFSPPDITELEIEEVASSLRSGWITTGPRVKQLERRLAAYIETGRTDIDCDSEEGIEKYKDRVVWV